MKQLSETIFLVLLVLFLAACDETVDTPEAIDLSKEQLDVLFVSASDGYFAIYGLKDTLPNQVWNLSWIFDTFGHLDPGWSPDGRKYIFTNIEDVYQTTVLHSNIYVFNMDCTLGRALQKVTYDTIAWTPNYDPTINAHPDWHPDGRHVVFVSNISEIYQIYFSTLSDSLSGDPTPVRLTTEEDLIDLSCFPSFSPEGTRIVYSSPRSGHEELWIMELDGSHKTQLTDLPGGIKRRPRFSPSGDKISFTSTMWTQGNDSSQIYTVNADGSGLDTITTSGNNADAAWSPDGTALLYAKRESKSKSHLYIINQDGTGERKFVNDSHASHPIWRQKR